MKVTERSTGTEKTALYITTASGNKRMWVDGKTYTDKQFDKLFSLQAPAKSVTNNKTP